MVCGILRRDELNQRTESILIIRKYSNSEKNEITRDKLKINSYLEKAYSIGVNITTLILNRPKIILYKSTIKQKMPIVPGSFDIALARIDSRISENIATTMLTHSTA